MNEAHLVFGQVQCVSDSFSLFMCPLASYLYGYAALIIYIGNSSLWGQVGVLLGWGAIFTFDDHIRLAEGSFAVSKANAIVGKNI